MTALYEIVAEYRAQLDALAELDLDAQTYADTLESMDGDLQDKLRAVIAYSLDLEIEATGAAAAAVPDHDGHHRQRLRPLGRVRHARRHHLRRTAERAPRRLQHRRRDAAGAG